jgi:transmembrane sensor
MHLTEDLLRRYFENRCTPEEERFVQEALQQDDAAVPGLLENYWKQAAEGAPLAEADRHAMFQTIQGRIGVHDEPRKIVSRPWFGGLMFRVAASVTILIGAIVGGYFFFRGSRAPQYYTITSQADRQQITMPDSSVIWLASYSRLTYTSNYNKEDRRVRLVGEAYFEVRRDTQRPFIVATSTLSTRVLGTHFNVKAEQAEDNIAVTLLEGKVSVAREDSVQGTSEELALLDPDQQLIYNRQTGDVTRMQVAAYDYAAWKDGVLNLKNMTFQDALRRLEKWYGVTIVVADPAINRCMIHASFKNESLPNVLKTIGMTVGFTYKVESHTVKIEGRGCSVVNR